MRQQNLYLDYLLTLTLNRRIDMIQQLIDVLNGENHLPNIEYLTPV